MASAKWYGQGLLKCLNKEVDFDTDTIKVMLCQNGYTPDADNHVYKSSVSSECPSTGNYNAGGTVLSGKTLQYIGPGSTNLGQNSGSTTAIWATSTAYVVGDLRRPIANNGHVYMCTVAGTSSGSAPTWPTSGGSTVVDGGVTWKEMGSNLLRLDGSDVTWGSSTITARYAVLYADTGSSATSVLLGYVDFTTDQSSSNGNFTLTWDPAGIFNIVNS